LASDAKRFLTMLAYYENPQNLGAAEAQTMEALNANPNYVPGMMVLGLLQNQRGQSKEAILTFEKVISRFPQFCPAQRTLAILYSTDPAREKQAFDLATKARSAMPQDPVLAKTLGQLCHNRKDFQNAVRLLQETVANAPSDADALYYLGSSYHQLKDKVRAKDALQKALAAGLKEPLAKEANRIVGTL
jgi:Flp pilus assembly protein TadD